MRMFVFFSFFLNRRKSHENPCGGMVYKLLLLIHQPALTPSVLRIGFLEVVVGTTHAATAAGGIMYPLIETANIVN